MMRSGWVIMAGLPPPVPSSDKFVQLWMRDMMETQWPFSIKLAVCPNCYTSRLAKLDQDEQLSKQQEPRWVGVGEMNE
jgi:hypothetical protein